MGVSLHSTLPALSPSDQFKNLARHPASAGDPQDENPEFLPSQWWQYNVINALMTVSVSLSRQKCFLSPRKGKDVQAGGSQLWLLILVTFCPLPHPHSDVSLAGLRRDPGMRSFFKKLPDISRMQPGLRSAGLGRRLMCESDLGNC